MKNSTKRMATCAMMAALCVIIMVLGAVLELGLYAAPLLSGLLFIPVGQKYGRKYQAILYAVSGILCFLFVPNVEQNLMFTGLFGWYPIVRPVFQKLPKILRLPVKLVVFNVIYVAIEALVMYVLVPEAVGDIMLIVLFVLGNIMFVLYDLLFPRLEILMSRFKKIL